jgi:hypothetical protein
LICFHLATVLLPASRQRMHPSQPLRPSQMMRRSVWNGILHVLRGFGGGARCAAEQSPPTMPQPAQW